LYKRYMYFVHIQYRLGCGFSCQQACEATRRRRIYVPGLYRLFSTPSVNGNRAADMMGTELQTFPLTAKKNNEKEMIYISRRK